LNWKEYFLKRITSLITCIYLNFKPEKTTGSSEVDVDPAEDPNYANEMIDNQRKKMLSKSFADQKIDL